MRGITGAVVLATVVWLQGCAAEQVPAPDAGDEQIVERARVTMGSPLRLTASTTDPGAAEAAFEAVFDEFDRLDAEMSVWRAGSDIERLNAAAGAHAVQLGPDVTEALAIAQQIGEWTDGRFDVTFGALSGVWKFDHDQDNRVPALSDVEARVRLVDFRALQLDAHTRTAFLARKGMRVHLGGIGKGYAVDRGAAILRSRGVHNAMIESGGDLWVGGRRQGRPWRVGIRDPRGAAATSFAALELTDLAMSTSGDYERFFIQNGRRFHHILDPRTGQPAEGSRSVTIVATRSVIADGLATGVFVLGGDAGMALIERLPDVEGVIVTSRNELLVSSGLRRSLAVRAPPTDAP